MLLTRQDLSRGFLLLAVIAAPLVLYGPHARGSFFWDDIHLVRDHPLLRADNGWYRVFATELLEGAGYEKTQFYHPIPLLTLWLQFRISTAFIWLRFVNILFHTINVALVALVLARVRLSIGAVALGAAAFAVHPLGAEPTMLLCGRHDTIAVTFALGALLVGPLAASATTMGQHVLRSVLVGLFCMWAFISKEASVAAVPLVALATCLSYVVAVHGPSVRRTAIACAAPFCGLGAAWVLRHELAISGASAQLYASPAEHLRNYGTLLGEYGKYAVLFTNGTTTRIFVPYSLGTSAAVVAGWGALLVGAATWVRMERRQAGWGPASRVFLGLCWFLLGLSPHLLSLPMLGMWGNRYGYFPTIGLVLSLASLAEVAVLRLRPMLQKALVGACGLPMLLAAGNTASLARTWHDGVALFESDTVLEPENHLAHYHLGVEVERVAGCEAALPHFWRATVLKPDYARAVHNVAGCLIRLGRFQEAEGFAIQALALAPTNRGSMQNLLMVQLRMGKIEEARKTLARGLELYPQLEMFQAVRRDLPPPSNERPAP
jgi:tetratricopeptide (TPR) repeat protein